MLSLDSRILDASSAVAQRMARRYAQDFLYILVTASRRETFTLNEKLIIFSVSGSKIMQFFRLCISSIHLIRLHHITHVTTQDPFALGLIGVFLKLFLGVNLEVQLHGDFYGSDYYRSSGLRNFFYYYFGKIVLCFADRVRVVGQRIYESLIRLGVPKDRLSIAPIPTVLLSANVQFPHFDVRQTYPQYEKIFLFLGRFDHVKNLPWLLEIFRGVVRVRSHHLLLLVGDGPERVKLTSLILQFNLTNNVIIKPWTHDVSTYLHVADCLLLPSLSEGYGLVVMEALAAERPVIMNDVGVARYEAKPSSLLTILSINDREAWLRALITL